MTDKLRVGIIGCGGIGRAHAWSYHVCGRYNIVALADLHPAAMENMDTQLGIETEHFQDARQMLDDVLLDVVSVCTWHGSHATWTIAAAARRPKAILCEKPMAESLGRAEQMLVACQRNGVKLAIGHQRRFLPSYTMARKLIAEGAIGAVELMMSVSRDGLPNSAAHQTDLYRYLLGDDDCAWVMGNVERKTDRYERGTRIEDGAVGVFQFKGGARALVLADVAPLGVYHRIHIYGSAGTIKVSPDDLDLLNGETGGDWKHYEPEFKYAKEVEPGNRSIFYVLPGAVQMEELAEWIEGKRDHFRNEAQNGFKALEMVLAVYESARRHEHVVLPLQTRLNALDLMVESGDLPVQRPGRYDVRATKLHGEAMTSHEEGNV
jgi:predicted dehydrogenase